MAQQAFAQCAGICYRWNLLDDAAPVRPVVANAFVPLRIRQPRGILRVIVVCGRRHRARSGPCFIIRALVEALARLGRGVAGAEAGVLCPRLLRRRIAVPQEEVVVTVQRLHQIRLRIELRAHLPDVVAEKDAELAQRQRITAICLRCQVQPLRLGHPRVVVDPRRIQQHMRQAQQQRLHARAVAAARIEELQPQPAQSRHCIDRQLFDARILQQRNDGQLHRPEPAALEALLREGIMRGRMRSGCAV